MVHHHTRVWKKWPRKLTFNLQACSFFFECTSWLKEDPFTHQPWKTQQQTRTLRSINEQKKQQQTKWVLLKLSHIPSTSHRIRTPMVYYTHRISWLLPVLQLPWKINFLSCKRVLFLGLQYSDLCSFRGRWRVLYGHEIDRVVRWKI